MNKKLLITFSLVLVLLISACTTYYEPTGDVVLDVDETQDPTLDDHNIGDINDVEEIIEGTDSVEQDLDELDESGLDESTETVDETEENVDEVNVDDNELPDDIKELLEELEKELESTETDVDETDEPTEYVDKVNMDDVSEFDIVAYEGDLIDLKPYVLDPDGDSINIGYTSPFDNKGMWQTKLGDSGYYSVIVTATDNKNSFVTKQMTVNVLIKNNPPVIKIAEKIEFDEGDLIKLNPDIYDEDGDEIVVIYSGFMDSRKYQSGYDDAGEYVVTIRADDGKVIVMENVKLVINDVNREPTLTLLNMNDLSVTEGEVVEILVESNDLDGDEIVFQYSAPFDTNGKWQTKKGDAGEYSVEVTANDGTTSVTESIEFVVDKLNTAPTILSLGVSPQYVELKKPGDKVTLSISVEAEDIDGDELTVSYSGFMNSASKTVKYGEKGGLKTVTVTVSDGTDSVTKDVTFDMNNWPCFDCQLK
jgi:hypothetical protein